MSIAMNAPLSHSSTRRIKLTVNEQVERILHGALQEEEPRTATADARDDQAVRRSRQLSNLYTSSVEDKFLKARMQCDGAKSVPKNARLGQRKVTDVPPIQMASTTRILLDASQSNSGSTDPLSMTTSPIAKPVKCYAKLMLNQLAQQENEERKKIEATQFPAPDFSPPKPWYTGYSSQTKAAASSTDAKIRRYGAYGTIKMLASESASGTVPHFRLHESQSLDSLAYKDAPNAWSPTLRGSPTMWPEDSNYATGCKLQAKSMIRCASPDFRFPSHVVGKSESPPEDLHYHRMQHIHGQDARDLEAAFEQEKMRRRQEIEYNKDKFDHWTAQLHFEALSSKMDHPFVKVHAKRANELTILHTPHYSHSSKHNDQVDKLTKERFALRWPNLGIVLDVMKKTPCRRPVLQDIDKLLALSYEISLQNLNHLELNRTQFMELMQKEYPLVDATPLNRVFSSYDFKLEDRIDMRLFLSTVRAMRVQQGTPMELITLALHDFDISKRQVISKAAHFTAIVCMCSGNDDEEREISGQARALWTHMVQDFAEEKERRRQRKLRGILEDSSNDKDEPFVGDGSVSLSTDETGDDAQSEIESLLFLSSSKGDETQAGSGIPIQFVRKTLRVEKTLLNKFTEMLLKRREQLSTASPSK